jgi:hypothetical protein
MLQPSRWACGRERSPAACFLACCILAIALLVPMTAHAAPAAAPMTADRAPILILDGGLGDVRNYSSHWLGEPTEVAAKGAVRLLTSPRPKWWSGAGAPDTYVLTAADGTRAIATAPIGVGEIGWALDELAKRHPEGKAVIVAQGAMGLTARAYIEDVASPRQSARADVVGLVMLGTPNAGLSLMKTYPKLDVWAPFAAGAGLSTDDVAVGSPLLQTLDAGKFPSVVKSLVVQGVAADFGGLENDGIVVRSESVVTTGVVSGPIDYVTAKARASETWPFGATWLPATKKGGATIDVIGDTAVQTLDLARGYSTAPDVRDAVKTFYETWFAAGAPVTHVSTRLVFDVSGSMDKQWGATTKMVAGRRAVADFTAAMSARQALPGSVPEDIGLVLFNETARVAVSGNADAASVLRSLSAAKAAGNTNVGNALKTAVASFSSAPQAADKYVVLLSDGVNTAGLDEKGILSGPVAQAARKGVRIDTIALGTVQDSDVGFLKKVATGTGGTFYQARDLFDLRTGFLRSRYSSVGTLSVDADITLKGAKPIDLGTLAKGGKLLEVTALPDGPAVSWEIVRDGSAVPTSSVKTVVSADGVTLLAIPNPEPGTYALRLVAANGSTRAHVFAITQADAFRPKGAAAPPNSDATLLLVVVGVVALGAIAFVIFSSMRGRGRRGEGSQEFASVDEGQPAEAEEEGDR